MGKRIGKARIDMSGVTEFVVVRGSFAKISRLDPTSDPIAARTAWLHVGHGDILVDRYRTGDELSIAC